MGAGVRVVVAVVVEVEDVSSCRGSSRRGRRSSSKVNPDRIIVYFRQRVNSCTAKGLAALAEKDNSWGEIELGRLGPSWAQLRPNLGQLGPSWGLFRMITQKTPRKD